MVLGLIKLQGNDFEDFVYYLEDLSKGIDNKIVSVFLNVISFVRLQYFLLLEKITIILKYEKNYFKSTYYSNDKRT